MSDKRFAKLKSDPRFRRPRTQTKKVVVDERFKSLFTESKGGRKHGQVDKYGRQAPKSREADNLNRFYRLEGDDDAAQQPDLARGQVLLESSDEESDDGDSSASSDAYVTVGAGSSATHRNGAVEADIDLDEEDLAVLDAQATAYRDSHPDGVEQPAVDETKRLAIVNLDWDHVRAVHLFKICSSLVSPTAPSVPTSSRGGAKVVRGKVHHVRVYLSQFGKERIAREEVEGPPPEIFKKPRDDDMIDETTIYEVGGQDDHDEDALRNYQLERLRYYYALVTCDSVETAAHIYAELEGTELERSANVFDMSFVPDDMEFDEEFRDEATDEPDSNFKAVEFVTDALRHSKVKLTWDDDDSERVQLTRKRMTVKEMEESNFHAYLASSSSESESEEPKSKRKAASRDRLRSLLLSNNSEDLPEGWARDGDDADDVDMEVTFAAGFSKSTEEETSLETYQRKMKEKRQKRKQELKEKSSKPTSGADDFFETAGDDDGADAPPAKSIATAEELSLIVSSNDAEAEPKHFNMKAVLKAEKKARLKGKKGKSKRTADDYEAQEEFNVDTTDDRFKALYEDPSLAIDPSHPQFKKTKAMSAFLDERTRRRKNLPDTPQSSTSSTRETPKDNLHSLVERVKRDSHKGGNGSKRRRVG